MKKKWISLVLAPIFLLCTACSAPDRPSYSYERPVRTADPTPAAALPQADLTPAPTEAALPPTDAPATAAPIITAVPVTVAPVTPEPVQKPERVLSACVDVYDAATETCLRRGERVGDLADLADGEYFSFVLEVEYNGAQPLTWETLQVSVDGGKPLGWTAGSLAPGGRMNLHIYHAGMQPLLQELGEHSCEWYMDGKLLHTDTLFLTRDLNWSALTQLPTAQEIEAYTNPENLRSPYMAMWLDVPHDVRYTEYKIDFKADHLPLGTYCALGNWNLDYSALEAQYAKVERQGISGYAGLQNIHNGDKMAIMSFWDVLCTDAAGTVTTLRPRVIYPESAAVDGGFGNEGTGAQCIDPYDWEANHWYRMHLKSYTGDSGTTVIEMWVRDLETGSDTKICTYDTLVPDSAFKGSIAIFLENYLPAHAGDIRTMEVCHAQYLDEANGTWKTIRGGTMHPNGGAYVKTYAGSYDYGASDGRLWIMTTGVGNRQDTNRDLHVVWEE